MRKLLDVSRYAGHTVGGRTADDAQGPCMVIHPTRKGVALAVLTCHHKPSAGFHYEEPSDVAVNVGGVSTYYPERVATTNLFADASSLLEEDLALRAEVKRLRAALVLIGTLGLEPDVPRQIREACDAALNHPEAIDVE